MGPSEQPPPKSLTHLHKFFIFLSLWQISAVELTVTPSRVHFMMPFIVLAAWATKNSSCVSSLVWKLNKLILVIRTKLHELKKFMLQQSFPQIQDFNGATWYQKETVKFESNESQENSKKAWRPLQLLLCFFLGSSLFF